MNDPERIVSNTDLKFALDAVVQTIISEMGIRFGEVHARLDRMDTSMKNYSKQIAAGARSIAGLNEWVEVNDEEYHRLLNTLADLQIRVSKLEGPK